MIDVGAERDPTLQHLEYGAHQRFRRAAFGDIAPGPSPDRLHGIRRVLMHGEDQNARRGIPLPNTLDGFNATKTRHGQIHDDEVRPCLLVKTVGLGAVAGLGHDLQPRLLREQRAISLPYDCVIVDQHDGRGLDGGGLDGRGLRHAACLVLPGRATADGTGIWAHSTRPLGRAVAMLNWPPSATIRSRMPSRPMPDPAVRSAPALPSSSTMISIWPRRSAPAGSSMRRRSVTRDACACFAALVMASCAILYRLAAKSRGSTPNSPDSSIEKRVRPPPRVFHPATRPSRLAARPSSSTSGGRSRNS